MANADFTVVPNNKPQPSIKGPLDTQTIMSELWERAADSLSKEELKWFTGATQQAECAVDSLNMTIRALAHAVAEGNDKEGAFSEPCYLSNLLFHTSFSLEAIQGLLFIGDAAQLQLGSNAEALEGGAA